MASVGLPSFGLGVAARTDVSKGDFFRVLVLVGGEFLAGGIT